MVYINRMVPTDNFDGEATPREQADALFTELTKNGTRKTRQYKTHWAINRRFSIGSEMKMTSPLSRSAEPCVKLTLAFKLLREEK